MTPVRPPSPVESTPVMVVKATILATAVLLFLWPLATPLGLVSGLVGTLLGAMAVHRLTQLRLRLSSGLLLGVVTGLVGWGLNRLVVSTAWGLGPTSALVLADGLLLGLTTMGGAFIVRLLSSRLRAFSVLELALVVMAVAHTFADHRHQRIHQPRFLSDWAWTNGFEPETLLGAVGVVAVAVAALLLLRARRGSRLVAMLLLVLLLGGLGAAALSSERLGTGEGQDDLGLTSDDKKDQDDGQGGGSSSSSKPPNPVAVAVLHDDLPDADVLYFRQAVRSRLVGNRLVEDNSGKFDLDVPTRVLAGAPLPVTTPQVPVFHRPLHTSMFLLVDHAQLLGLGFPTEFRPLQNPNPRRFVAAYDVDSQFALRSIDRLLGRQALPSSWSDEERSHYLAIPDDPRYLELSNRLVRDVDPRFVGDDVMKALAIKRFLEKQGFYSLKEKNLTGDDPVAEFLFHSLRGYCVHFAHAAVFLFRSQGIPARVAIGYGVQTNRRGAGSAVLIFANEAHAWPEIYLDGVGWVTLDVYPEQSDEPPSPHVDQDLESALGELARKDPTGGKAPDPTSTPVPWRLLFSSLAFAVVAVVYGIKAGRRLWKPHPRLQYRAVLDRLSDLGAARHWGESREHHATRVATLAPSFLPLTQAHLRLALRADTPEARHEVATWAEQTTRELRRNPPWAARLKAFFNPIGWWFTR